MKRIGVISKNPLVYNKIRLLLRDTAAVEEFKAEANGAYTLVIADIDSADKPDFECVTLGRGGDLPLPFRHEDMIALVTGTEGEAERFLSLSADGRHAYISGEEIKLTEVEYKLLEVILKADGFVSKEQILDTVWGDGYDLGVVNVYVHYLRRKLEKGGNKVIISSRNEGYRIDEKYRRKS